MAEYSLAPGSRVVIRDEEWIVRKLDMASSGGLAVSVVGISELVKDKEAVFLTELEEDLEVIKPENTKPVKETSSRYIQSRLYIESLLRQTPPNDEKLYISQHAAIDNNPYQFDPAIEALKHPRQRILMADGVGLGKTIEVGILLTELIKRGRGKRILVAVIKSMLTQFQKELWGRFTIPLVRLDSAGIQRIRSLIPSNANPFYYYDKTIISIDTLKQDASYRTYLENSYWDIIVIDECHNVAIRGKGKSQRARLAQLLANRSDTLILASATPHDGRAETFASLMNMLDPTAIANPKNYKPEDIRGLFIRRFKKDIQDQVATAFKDRRPARKIETQSTKAEENAFRVLTGLDFKRIDRRRARGEHLFLTILEKSLFSSPAACLETIRNRMKRLEKETSPEAEGDLAQLCSLEGAVEQIPPKAFSKYQKLLWLLQDKNSPLVWNGKDTEDRLIIFAERIETLKFLEKQLLQDLSLKEKDIELFHGGLPDKDQQEIVDKFGKLKSPLKLLLASDVASEGINLHFYCHKMIHFDIPWSLMTFQQRNGRIDRYGQQREPMIYYLLTLSDNDKIKGDMRILEILVEKEENAVRNIGDPAALLGVYDSEQEERIVGSTIEGEKTVAGFAKLLDEPEIDLLAMLMGEEKPVGEDAQANLQEGVSLFADDFAFFKQALEFVGQTDDIHLDVHPKKSELTITAGEELKHRFKYLPNEIIPEHWNFRLSIDREAVQKSYRDCRTEEKTWPKVHLLWDLHPVAMWLHDKLLSRFGRHEAPVLYLPEQLKPGEIITLLYALVPNQKSQPLVSCWFAVSIVKRKVGKVYTMPELLDYTQLHKVEYPSISEFKIKEQEIKLDILLAIQKAKDEITKLCRERERDLNAKLEEQYRRLENLREKKMTQLELDFSQHEEEKRSERTRDKREQGQRRIDDLFNAYRKWVDDTLKIESNRPSQTLKISKKRRLGNAS